MWSVLKEANCMQPVMSGSLVQISRDLSLPSQSSEIQDDAHTRTGLCVTQNLAISPSNMNPLSSLSRLLQVLWLFSSHHFTLTLCSIQYPGLFLYIISYFSCYFISHFCSMWTSISDFSFSHSICSKYLKIIVSSSSQH